LASEIIGWVDVQGSAEFSQRLHWRSAGESAIPPLQVVEHQLLANHLP
jgi:hypothetical protein